MAGLTLLGVNDIFSYIPFIWGHRNDFLIDFLPSFGSLRAGSQQGIFFTTTSFTACGTVTRNIRFWAVSCLECRYSGKIPLRSYPVNIVMTSDFPPQYLMEFSFNTCFHLSMKQSRSLYLRYVELFDRNYSHSRSRTSIQANLAYDTHDLEEWLLLRVHAVWYMATGIKIMDFLAAMSTDGKFSATRRGASKTITINNAPRIRYKSPKVTFVEANSPVSGNVCSKSLNHDCKILLSWRYIRTVIIEIKISDNIALPVARLRANVRSVRCAFSLGTRSHDVRGLRHPYLNRIISPGFMQWNTIMRRWIAN